MKKMKKSKVRQGLTWLSVNVWFERYAAQEIANLFIYREFLISQHASDVFFKGLILMKNSLCLII